MGGAVLAVGRVIVDRQLMHPSERVQHRVVYGGEDARVLRQSLDELHALEHEQQRRRAVRQVAVKADLLEILQHLLQTAHASTVDGRDSAAVDDDRMDGRLFATVRLVDAAEQLIVRVVARECRRCVHHRTDSDVVARRDRLLVR